LGEPQAEDLKRSYKKKEEEEEVEFEMEITLDFCRARIG